MKWTGVVCFLIALTTGCSLAADSMVLSPSVPASSEMMNDEALTNEPAEPLKKPTVNSLRIDSSIQHRYAKTRVISRLANPANISQEVVFDMVLPKKAFITSFLMEIKGKVYKAYIKEKEEAAKVYQAAVQAGQTAAHVEVTARDSNHFGISVNIEANGKVKFLLNYEELLTRNLGKYNHVVNLNPGQVVNDLEVNVYIQEAVNITDVYVPELRVTNEISEEKEKENVVAKIDRPDSKRVHVLYRPSVAEQAKYAPSYGGQLVVQYDVDRSVGNQILVNDGYFVHFFSPQIVQPLRKLAVFVLDVSGSMYGRKMEQLKGAMNTILDNLGKDDYFNIIDFSHGVTVHNLENGANSPVVKPQYDFDYYGEPTTESAIKGRNIDFPSAYPNTEEFINRTKDVISRMEAAGGTNIHDALKTALGVAQNGVKQIRLREGNNKSGAKPIEPIIIFLTDGDPTVGVTNHQRIFTATKEHNYMKTPIFSLGFGSSADMKFLRRISLGNHAFARSIYEAADAASQLRNFYQQVASPLLANVSFNYVNGQIVEGSLTKEKFPTLFLGSELVVAGKIGSDTISGLVNATSSNGKETFVANYVLPPHKSDPAFQDWGNSDETSGEDSESKDDDDDDHSKKGSKTVKRNTLERLWAYVTVQDLIDTYDVLDSESDKEQAKAVKKNATDMALRFKFVTPFTSLVVVKPNNSKEVTSAKEGGPHISEASSSFSHFHSNKVFAMARPHGPGGGYAMTTTHVFAAVPPMSAYRPPQTMKPHIDFASPSVDSIKAMEAAPLPLEVVTTTLDTPTNEPNPTWFENALSEDNTTVSLPFGPDNATLEYKWQLLESLNDSEVYENCSLPNVSTAANSTGEHKCKHLLHCPTFKRLISLDEYKMFFCTIPGGEKPFAGMCCPADDIPLSIDEETTSIIPTTMKLPTN